MITIYAEKPDVGKKIAAALDKITLSSGKTVTFDKLEANDKAIKAQQHKDGYLKIRYMNDDCYVTWGYGHLCSLKQAEDYDSSYKNWKNLPVPFIPEKYEVKANAGTKDQFNIVKNLMNKSSLIINATDDDREGEVIFAYLYEAIKCKVPYKRSHFASQTKEGITDGFKKLKTPSQVKNTELAGRARGIADADIGWNGTAQMTLKFAGPKEVLSIGRCQTATLNILAKRELEIRNFKPEDYFTLEAEFITDKSETYKGEHIKKRFANKKEAEDILKKITGKNGIVTDIQKKTQYKDNPNLYSQSLLQMDASSKYGFPLDKTLKIAQSLYDKGFTTYPRTDSQYLTEDMEPTVNEILDMLDGNSAYKPFITGKGRKINRSLFFDNSKVSSHYAIIPTKVPAKGLSPDEEKIYDLICKSVIRMIYDKAQIERTTVTTSIDGENFITNGSVIVKKGWMEVGYTAKEEFIPMLSKNQVVSAKPVLKAKKTEPPKRYSDKTLVAAMISAGKNLDDDTLKKFMASHKIQGIGREATRAEIVKTLIERGYAIRSKGNIISATDKGIELISLIPFEDIKSAELTAKWEQRLSNIENGTEKFEDFIKDIEKLTEDLCNKIVGASSTSSFKGASASGGIGGGTTSYVCPDCGKPIVKYGWGYGCSGNKDGCKFSISAKIASKTLSDTAIKQLFTKGETSEISGFVSKTGAKFSASIKLEKEGGVTKTKFEFGTKSSAYKCPACGKDVVKHNWGYGCSGYKDGCKFSISAKIAGKSITQKMVKDLCEKKETDKIDGFKGKNGEFSAKLYVKEDNTVGFKF